MAAPGSFDLQLRRFGRDVVRQTQASIESFADEVVAEAIRIAPVGETGNYRASIRKDKSFSVLGAIGGLVGIGQGAWSWYIISDVPYATRLEHGHSKQAPNGVFGVAVTAVRSRYGLR